MFCPFTGKMCIDSCALWNSEEELCSFRLAAESLSELSALAMDITGENGEEPEPVKEDLPFC